MNPKDVARLHYQSRMIEVFVTRSGEIDRLLDADDAFLPEQIVTTRELLQALWKDFREAAMPRDRE